jgi:TonB family protein
MRSIIATLILTPALLHAQVSKQAAGISLEARTDALKMAMPAVNAAVTPTAASGTPILRVSTGVLAAKIIHRTEITYSPLELNTTDNRVVVRVLVNEQGLPQSAEIVSSRNPDLNQRVLEAVKQYRFRPAQLDQQAVPEHVNLTFVFER